MENQLFAARKDIENEIKTFRNGAGACRTKENSRADGAISGSVPDNAKGWSPTLE